VEVDYNGQIEKAAGCFDVGDVATPSLVRMLWSEVSVEDVDTLFWVLIFMDGPVSLFLAVIMKLHVALSWQSTLVAGWSVHLN
jgi:hypothetical protein